MAGNERQVELPGVNMRVGLLVGDCCKSDLKTRVENVVDGGLVVAAPMHPCGMAMPYDRTPVVVHWSDGGAAMELPAEISATRMRPVAVWELRRTGPVTRVQRRRFVRVETPALPVELGVNGKRMSAWLADLSEGGLRCTMERLAAAGLLPGDNTVTWLRLGDGLNLALPAQVVRVEQGGEDHVEVACQFVGIPPGTADQLRRYVFAEQARQRRREAGLDT